MKDTNNLRQELMEAPSLDQFLSENQDSFNRDSIYELLNRLFQKRRISKATLAKQSGMSEVYLHQVFSGRRNPSRSRLLCLCFGPVSYTHLDVYKRQHVKWLFVN